MISKIQVHLNVVLILEIIVFQRTYLVEHEFNHGHTGIQLQRLVVLLIRFIRS